MSISPTTAKALVNDGFAFVPVSESLVEDAAAANRAIIALFQDDPERFSLMRPGEPESDVGLIYRPGGVGKDHKYFLHYAEDLPRLMPKELADCAELQTHLTVLQRLHQSLGAVGLTVGEQCERDLFEVFDGPITSALLDSILNPGPYNATTLRGLYYPASREQRGAKLHIDRSFLTLHVGDTGGKLFGRMTKTGEGGTAISPERGFALLFFGVKAFLASRGAIEPLWHWSTVETGSDREALVQFAHVAVGAPISDAEAAYDAFRARW